MLENKCTCSNNLESLYLKHTTLSGKLAFERTQWKKSTAENEHQGLKFFSEPPWI